MLCRAGLRWAAEARGPRGLLRHTRRPRYAKWEAAPLKDARHMNARDSTSSMSFSPQPAVGGRCRNMISSWNSSRRSCSPQLRGRGGGRGRGDQ